MKEYVTDTVLYALLMTFSVDDRVVRFAQEDEI